MYLKDLRRHLAEENPLLLDAIPHIRRLDRIARKMGRLAPDDTFGRRISWWPLVAVMGVYSSGKSTFINRLVGRAVQKTGNQAVDDKFTALSYAAHEEVRSLPGLALDADPRFPFFRVSAEIERSLPGEGARIDSYLQLKTCRSPALRGRILIDSPGFDADAQRDGILRIANHILDLADLVLVFFDARHPEPGAMRDTLSHLVAAAVGRSDAEKFVYVLNQIDMTARDDNTDNVVGAWQRALAQHGMTAGLFLEIYDPDVSIAIDDPALRDRLAKRREVDFAAILERMDQLGIERSYRVLGGLDNAVAALARDFAPASAGWLQRWRRRVLLLDAAWLIAVGSGTLGLFSAFPQWLSWDFFVTDWRVLVEHPTARVFAAALAVFAAGHVFVRVWARRMLARRLREQVVDKDEQGALLRSLKRSTVLWRPFLLSRPRGWSRRVERRTTELRHAIAASVQALNDRFSDPSGRSDASAESASRNSRAESPMAGEPTMTPLRAVPNAADDDGLGNSRK